MNKKAVGVVIVAIVAIIAAGLGVWLVGGNNKTDKQPTLIDNSEEDKEKIAVGKTLVAYFSAQNHTEAVAEQIVRTLEADLFEIEPVETYTEEDLDWMDDNSRTNREHNDIALREVELIATTVPNWDEYDTVFVGYPIWWGIAAWPIEVFVKANNFENKNVIPFCTSASSGLGDSANLLATAAGSGRWLPGHCFNSSASADEVKVWLKDFKQ